MLRRLGAVLAGMIACQVSMLVCLAAGVGLLMVAPAASLALLAGVGLLLALPGLAGGALTGLLADRRGALLGTLASLLFGLTIVAVKVLVAPGFGYAAATSDMLIYPALTGALGVTGALGGLLGQRIRRAGPPASTRAVVRQSAGYSGLQSG